MWNLNDSVVVGRTDASERGETTTGKGEPVVAGERESGAGALPP